jgi:hypothetical protein
VEPEPGGHAHDDGCDDPDPHGQEQVAATSAPQVGGDDDDDERCLESLTQHYQEGSEHVADLMAGVNDT